MKRQPTIAEIIMLAGGAITFLFSFFNFIGDGDEGRNAWSSDVFALFPNTAVIALFGLATVVVILVMWLLNPTLPKILTFDWKQILFAWGATSALFMLCYLITEKNGANFKIGGIFMLLGSLAMAVGATLNLLGILTTPVTSGAPKAVAAGTGSGGGPFGPSGGISSQPGFGSAPTGAPSYPPAPPAPPAPPTGGSPPPPPPPGSGGTGTPTPPPPPPV